MGDFGGPLLSTVEATLPPRVKSGALHVENTQSPFDSVQNKQMNAMPDTDSGPALKPVDTPMQNSTANTPAEPATPTSEQPSKQPPDLPKSKDFAPQTPETSRPASNASSNFKPPTPVRNYREHPRLWVDDGPEAGQATAEWRRKFVPVLEDQTEGMTVEERTKFFDKLVRDNEDRYVQPIATYYTVHPEHLPERELDHKTAKRIDEGMKTSPKVDMAQQKCFGTWNNWGPSTSEVVSEVGPKNEPSPDEEPAECEHCIKEAKKARSLIHKVLAPVRRKFSTSHDHHHHLVPVSRRATESNADKPTDLAMSQSKTSTNDEEQDKEGRHSGSGSSSDGKEREALTETGVGMTKAISVPKKRVSIAQKLHLSTVHTG